MLRRHAQSLGHVRLFATPWTVAHQAPLSMGFPRQEYWSGLPFILQGDIPDPGIKSGSPALQADSLPSEPLIWAREGIGWWQGVQYKCVKGRQIGGRLIPEGESQGLMPKTMEKVREKKEFRT